MTIEALFDDMWISRSFQHPFSVNDEFFPAKCESLFVSLFRDRDVLLSNSAALWLLSHQNIILIII